MKCLLILFYCLFLTINSFSSPVLELSEDGICDLGKFEARLAKEAVFNIKNSGDEDLVINTVRTTCGCAKLKSFPKVLKPNESGKVVIGLEAYGLSGPFSKLAFIQSNDPSSKTKRLLFKGNAIPLYKVSPSDKHLVNISSTNLAKQSKKFTFKISTHNGQKIILSKVKPINKRGVTASLRKVISQKEYQLTITISSEIDKGILRVPVKIPVKSPKNWKPIEILIYGKVK